ncbi:MAG: hypothetical protein C4543_06430 [Ignavibacteriales bacterium]|nr:MAG: hypothetical protein C4543_06430 [Ignavibacteriales bacterium]
MKIQFMLFFVLGFTIMLPAQNIDTIYIASWNIENLFDNVNDLDKEDEEFLSTGSKEWTDERIHQKMSNLSDVINFMNEGKGPDIIGFMEVEHKYLLEKMAITFLYNRKYMVVGFDSPDARGIDSYLMYDSDIFDLVGYYKIPVNFFNEDYYTRDILHVSLYYNDDILDVFVNHWPSRRGGEESSQPRRVNAASTLKRYVDSLQTIREFSNFLIVGDFNDEPNNYSLDEILSAKKMTDTTASLINLAWDDFENGRGTHLYNRDFNMLDQIIISRGLLDEKGLEYLKDSFEIISDDFFTYTDGPNVNSIMPSFHSGKYLNGYSDHLPVGAKLFIMR